MESRVEHVAWDRHAMSIDAGRRDDRPNLLQRRAVRGVGM